MTLHHTEGVTWRLNLLSITAKLNECSGFDGLSKLDSLLASTQQSDVTS